MDAQPAPGGVVVRRFGYEERGRATGLEGMPGVEWKIVDAKGRSRAYDSQEEALGEPDEYGQGASVRRREVYRVTFFVTRSVKGWERVYPPAD